MTKQEWFALFKDPRWQKKRLQILERDGFACKNCGDANSTLNVHHTFYWDKEDEVPPWDYNDVSLMTLCDSCHDLEHKEISIHREQLIRVISEAGLGSCLKLDTLIDAFALSLETYENEDADVFAWAIQSISASKAVYNGTATAEQIKSYDNRILVDPDLWIRFKDHFWEAIKSRSIKRKFQGDNHE